MVTPLLGFVDHIIGISGDIFNVLSGSNKSEVITWPVMIYVSAQTC
jgi:hypothetical protein